MTVNIQSVHFDADTKLLDHVNRKIARDFCQAKHQILRGIL